MQSQTSRKLGLSTSPRPGRYPAAFFPASLAPDSAVIRGEAVKFWLATLRTRLTLVVRIARTVFALAAVGQVPTQGRGNWRAEHLQRRSEVDHDPAGALAFKVGSLAIAKVEDRLVGVANDWFGEVTRKAVARGL